MMINATLLRTGLAALIVNIALAGCGANPLQPTATDSGAGQVPSTGGQHDNPNAARATTTATALTGQTFYQLLLAEIATNRREYGTAAELYSRLAQQEHDAEVVRRATALNQVVGNYQRMQQHAEIWTDLEPDTVEAWQALAIASLANADFETGQAALGHWLRRNPQAQADTALIGTQELNAEQLEQLTSVLKQLSSRFPDNSSLPFSIGQVLISQQSFAEALPYIRAARSLQDSPARGLLEYRVLLELDDIDAARSTLEELAEKYPQNADVATAYASFAYADGRQDKTELLQSLFNRFPDEPVIVRAFARESFDNGDYDTAEALFNRLTHTDFADEAHYFLGRINMENSRTELAVDHFLSTSRPPYLISALAELSEIWYPDRIEALQRELTEARRKFPQQGPVLWRIEADAYTNRDEPEQAFQTLEKGLAEHPNNVDLLYNQALLAGRLDRHEVLENNLRTVLEQEPDNASALNALGYTWADRDENLQQAERYIDRALELRPEDPAIMDSKGWVEYRQGNLETAEKWLRQALERFDNDEVAAHLGEVLWVMGRQEEARQWLRHAFELNASSPTAQAVVDKFGIEL